MAAEAPTSDPASQPLRRFKKRTGTTRERTGCLTCRLRRKKCVENTYPICGHCRRLNLHCERESPRSVVVSSSQSRQAPIFEPFDVQKVVALRPQRYEVMSIPDAMTFGQYVGVESPADSRYLLKYYTQVLANMLTTTHENNSFLSVFLPMAIESPPLLSTLIAWSTAHLSCFQPRYAIPALEKQSLALRSVSSALSTPSTTLSSQETNLAACLCLCSTEVVIGDTSQWHTHLLGAKHIILSATAPNPSAGPPLTGPKALIRSPDGAWLLRNFAYHDILGAVLTNAPPLIPGCYWQHDGVEVVDSYIGIASRILVLISEIASLESPDLPSPQSTPGDEAPTHPVDETDLWLAFISLEYRLQAWAPPPSAQAGLIAMAESYRAAGLLLLYRKMRSASRAFPDSELQKPLPLLEDMIATQVKLILQSLGEIPSTSLPECGALFPLFLAGGDARGEEEIEVVRGRMAELVAFRGFANIRRAREVLEELWRLRGCGMRGWAGWEVDWRDVVERTGEKLMLA